LEHLPFDNGPLAAADTLIASIKNVQEENQQMSDDMKNLSRSLTGKLQDVVGKFDETAVDNSPVELIKIIDERLFSLQEERDILAGKVQENENQLASLASEHETMSSELTQRKEVEEKFMKAKMMLNPSEGEVLYNSSNDIVLRLGGLSFASGKSDIKDEQASLLGKVIEIIKLYPDTKLIVEGHTDSNGDAYANQTLSEKRAFSVMQYLRQTLLLSADKIQSMGYGADRPIGSNKTKDGRAKNRRIDIILMR
jgi:outer membrane protein OmpA-like peptidoglycan-associated protein